MKTKRDAVAVTWEYYGTIVSNNGIRQIYMAIPFSPLRIDPSI